MSYAELLKDPRWQKKRLEIMERDEWTCQACRDTEATLTVHHKSYRMIDGKFVDIWDYPGEDLTTLCETCHANEEKNLDSHKKNMFFAMREYCQDAETLLMAVRIFKEIKEVYFRRVDIEDVRHISTLIDENFSRRLSLKESEGMSMSEMLKKLMGDKYED